MRLLKIIVLLAGMVISASAGDFDAVVLSARQAWPERRTVVVICNKDASAMALMDLGSSTENVISLLVVDITTGKNLEKMLVAATRKPWKEIFVLLIADDPVTGEGTEAARTLVSRMAGRGIPVVGTTPGSLKIGAVFAQGPGTGDKLLTNPEAAKKIGVPLPSPPTP